MDARVVKLLRQTDPSTEARAPSSVARRSLMSRANKIALLTLVALPTLLVAAYLYFFANDQYVAEFRFNLRRGSDAALASAASGSGSSARGMASIGLTATQVWDSQTVVQYIKSRDVVDELDAKLGFNRLYGRDDIDLVSRLRGGASVERRTEHWRSIVEPFFDMTTGVISVSVRAFSREDALAVATLVLAASEKMVNELSTRSREDAMAMAEGEVAKAEKALNDARLALRDFRMRKDVLDPSKSAEVDMSLQARLQERLSVLRSQHDVTKVYAPRSPSLPTLEAEIRSVEGLIQEQQAKLTSGKPGEAGRTGDSSLSIVLTDFEVLKLDESFKEKLYLFALQFREQSRIEAHKQQLYLNPFVRPKLPEESLYPKRLRTIAIVFAAGFALWALGALAYYSIRDHA
jgi:capsular polysaccharide transport system permease protein